jgi:hypothetical protein
MAEPYTASGGWQSDQADAGTAGWNLAQRVGFRFVFSYLVLYCLPFPLGWVEAFGWLNWPLEAYFRLQQAVTPWVAAHVLHLGQPVVYQPTGSGDTLEAYLWDLCLLAAAAVATAVWTLVDRRRQDYQRLHPWLRLYVRYWLACILLSYGMAKVIKTQFPTPAPDRLEVPVGQFSPMGLLWTFMGYSTPYNFFAGGMEALGGILLFFRRTTTLGALLTMAVIGNVVLLNFCYDVPVKLFSLHLLLAAMFLAAADARRLANLLVLNRPAAAVSLAPYGRRRWARIGLALLKTAFIGYVLYLDVTGSLANYRTMNPTGAKAPPLFGSYAVEEIVAGGGAAGTAAAPAASRWMLVNARGQDFWSVRRTAGPKVGYAVVYGKQTVTLSTFGTQDKAGFFTWSRPDPLHVVLQGTLNKVPVTIKLRALPEGSYPLMSRGFHWIQELPFNR